MSILLALETATDVCSVALLDAGTPVAMLTVARRRAHAEQVVPMIQEALRLAETDRRDVETVAVSAGPGSYTGLRIGVSTAKGLAAAVGAALVAVPTLEALAEQVRPVAGPDDLICPVLASRRGEVYLAAYLLGEAALEATRPATAIAVDDVAAWLPAPPGEASRLWLLGPGREALLPVLADSPYALRLLAPPAFAPGATPVGQLGWRRYQAGQTEDVAAYEPAYLKDYVAKKPKHTALERLSL